MFPDGSTIIDLDDTSRKRSLSPKPFTKDSARHAMLPTTFSLVDTEVVSRLTGIVAWKGVKQRVRQGIQLQGGIVSASYCL